MKYLLLRRLFFSVLMCGCVIVLHTPHTHAQTLPTPVNWGTTCKQARLALNQEIASTTRAQRIAIANSQRAAQSIENLNTTNTSLRTQIREKELRRAERARQPFGMRASTNYGMHHSEVHEAQAIIWNAEERYLNDFKTAYKRYWDTMHAGANSMYTKMRAANITYVQAITATYDEAIRRLVAANERIGTACTNSPQSTTTLTSARTYIAGAQNYIRTVAATHTDQLTTSTVAAHTSLERVRDAESARLNTAIKSAGERFAQTIISAQQRGVPAIQVVYDSPRLVSEQSLFNLKKYARRLLACTRCGDTRDEQILRDLEPAISAMRQAVENLYTPYTQYTSVQGIVGGIPQAQDAYNAALGIIGAAIASAAGIPAENRPRALELLGIDQVFVGIDAVGRPTFRPPSAPIVTMLASESFRAKVLGDLKGLFPNNPVMQGAQTPRAILSAAVALTMPHNADVAKLNKLLSDSGLVELSKATGRFVDTNARDSSGRLPSDFTPIDGSSIPRDLSCFDGETLVLMADGSHKKIKDVVVGDVVASFVGRGELVGSVVTDVIMHEVGLVRSVNDVLVTPEHRFLVRDGTYRPIDQLAIGNQIVDEHGNLVRIKKMSEVVGTRIVYNLEVENTETYVAGGYRVHNWK